MPIVTALGYIRVSTEEQAREGWSLDAQREKIQLYSQLHNLDLTDIIADEGISACNVRGRPGMKQLLELTTVANSIHLGAIITVKLDRLFRNAAEALHFSDIWRKRNIELHSIHEGVQTNGAAGKMYFALLAVFAEFERDQCSERTRAGLAKRKATGLKLGGECPYGYTADQNGYLIQCPGEQEIIRVMTQLRESGLSYQKVADQLNEQGYRNRSGRPWSAVTVHYLLKK